MNFAQDTSGRGGKESLQPLKRDKSHGGDCAKSAPVCIFQKNA